MTRTDVKKSPTNKNPFSKSSIILYYPDNQVPFILRENENDDKLDENGNRLDYLEDTDDEFKSTPFHIGKSYF